MHTYTLKKSSIRWRVPPSASCEYTEAVALVIRTREKTRRERKRRRKIDAFAHCRGYTHIYTHIRIVTDREQSDSYKIEFCVSSSLLYVSEIDCIQ